jgi:MbtH protein
MSSESFGPEQLVYRVVVNHEQQYSIWPADQKVPDGWNAEGTVGQKEDCLSRIDQIWTDMRPLSLRKVVAAAAISSRPGL